MKSLPAILGLVLVLAAPGMVRAAEQTATLKVENMSCVSCPYIVQRALTSVSGVERATVSFADKTAVVVYDDAKTNVKALTAATGKWGYPSTVVVKNDGY